MTVKTVKILKNMKNIEKCISIVDNMIIYHKVIGFEVIVLVENCEKGSPMKSLKITLFQRGKVQSTI